MTATRLIDLDPRWLSFRGKDRAAFMLRCPHCQNIWLTCKAQPMNHDEQEEMLLAVGLDPYGPGCPVVMCKNETAWTINGEFENLTVTPSLDASKSGHWHGHITNGEIK